MAWGKDAAVEDGDGMGMGMAGEVEVRRGTAEVFLLGAEVDRKWRGVEEGWRRCCRRRRRMEKVAASAMSVVHTSVHPAFSLLASTASSCSSSSLS